MFFSFSNIFFASSSFRDNNDANQKRSDSVMRLINKKKDKEIKEQCLCTCRIVCMVLTALSINFISNSHVNRHLISSPNNRNHLKLDNQTSSELDSRNLENIVDINISNARSQVCYSNLSHAMCPVRTAFNTRFLCESQKQEQDKFSRLSSDDINFSVEKRRQKRLGK
jgi:hypothetical protein